MGFQLLLIKNDYEEGSDTLTNIIVEDPVTAKTVQINAISRYQAKVPLRGIFLGSRKRCQRLFVVSVELLVVLFAVEDMSPFVL